MVARAQAALLIALRQEAESNEWWYLACQDPACCSSETPRDVFLGDSKSYGGGNKDQLSWLFKPYFLVVLFRGFSRIIKTIAL